MSFRGKNNNKKGVWRGGFRRGKDGGHFNKFHGNRSGNNSEKRECTYSHHNQQTEEDVGITEYISKLDGYSAIIKARYSDFQVNEINKEGKLAKLTDLGVPKDFSTTPVKSSYVEINESPAENLPQETWESLKKLASCSEVCEPVILEADKFSKDERKTLHECVKKYFGQEIVASTITKDGKTLLEFKKYDKTQKDNRNQWPQNIPEYVYFILYKEKMDTMEACFKLAHVLRISPSKITYAGVKDKRGKTTQWFCIKKYPPPKMITHTKKIRQLMTGNFEFHEQPLKLGHLQGNRFRIALRNVLAEDSLINDSLSHVKELGFINYYGMQRFGNSKEAPTFLIGVKLLLGQWKEAINLILKVKASDDLALDVNKAKKVYAETGDAAKALKLFKSEYSLEKSLLEGIAKHHENNHVDALENVPRNIRLMYIHAYQSLIWNKMASKRIKEFGLKPVEGDLILVGKDYSEEELVLAEEDNEEVESDSHDGEKLQMASDTSKEKSQRQSVRPLSANELDQYTVYDIVLPLPGFDVIYPENLKQYYKEAVEEYGLTLEMAKQRVKTYNLSGAYRKVVQRATDVEWKIMYYNDPTDNLIRSDLEELRGEEEPKSAENGKYKALIIAFTLNSASYATMVLREILKCDTSTSAQASMNDYAIKDKPKVIIESNGVKDVVPENQLDEVQQGSLLADKSKYEDFKNNLFKDILEDPQGETMAATSSKRELEGEEVEHDSKKLKTDVE